MKGFVAWFLLCTICLEIFRNQRRKPGLIFIEEKSLRHK
ncbi:hypothetical protein SLEP1_g19415 [Rubroshorea leprosula]|nr:hypothetical protein SLEP1_g19415 [Rubroshorea leprosula]